MNPERLIKLYDRVADAPDAVERLRKFVLDLAVRGKLVEQDEGEEPHPALLELIPVDEIEVPDSPHANWRHPKIGNVLNFRYGKGLKKSERLENGPVPVFGSNGIVGSTTKPLTDAPAIIVGRKGSAGALNICNGPSWTTDVAYFVESPPFLKLRYLFLSLQSLNMEELSKGVKPGLSRADAYELRLPVPPCAEQTRIVQRVDELTALLDRLETTRTRRETTRNRFTTTSLTRLTAPDTTEVSFPAHARFALDNLDQLTSRPQKIKELRQTILNLAVRGKLVEQDPADEPASDLLKRMAVDLDDQKSGHIRKPKLLPAVDSADAPFELPDGWAWARFPQLGKFGRGRSKHRPRNDPALYTGGSHLMIQTGDVARSGGRITTYTNKYNDVGLAQSMLWPKGTLCITIAANIADSGILEFPACFPDSVVGFVPNPVFENARYFEYFVRTAKANLLEFAPATAQKNINLEILTSVLIALPPLPEQQRIVAKVDALIALCDQMEEGLAHADTTRARLFDTILKKVLPSDTLSKEAA